MALTPQTTVLIDGVPYEGNTINQITINYGRNVVWEQPRSSYAQISLYNPTNTEWIFDLNSTVIVKTENATGTDRTLFTGKIKSIGGGMAAAGSIADVGLVEISASGVFAEMNRINIGGSNYPKEYDDDRMDRIFTEAGVSVDVVDTPGVYEFDARSGSTATSYFLASKYADMAFGYIYETTDGKVGYANESRRTVEAQTYGYWEIPQNYIQAFSITSQKTAIDVINSIYLTYGSNNSTTASSSGSITTYGEIAASILTELHNTAEAEYQASRYIALKANPETNIKAFTVALTNPNLSNADIDTFLQMYMGKPIEINDLPKSIIHTNYQGFVEGWTWSISRTNISISVNSTSSIFSLTPIRWQDVSAALTWSAVDPTIQWSNYN